MKIIIIAGQAGVGKTTLAKIIAEEAFDIGFMPKLMSFAGPLKKEAADRGMDKATKPEEYRIFCQEEGARRRAEDEDYWVNLFEEDLAKVAEKEAEDLKANKKYWERCVIIDDCRYPNEVRMGLTYGAKLLFLSYGSRENPHANADWKQHHSEEMNTLIDKGPSKYRSVFDCILKNQDAVEDLKEKVTDFIPHWCGIRDEKPEDYTKDEHMRDLSRCVSELIDLLIVGNLIDDQEEEEEDELDDWDYEFKEGAD